jgi:SAM-dependent methyltransferase
MNWTNSDGLGMGYQRFSVDPLTPQNRETELRIAQLKEDLACVARRSVLDIGCFAGLASIISLELGAANVLATDVDDRFFAPLRTWLTLKGLPGAVQQVDFKSLGEEHRRDVVLFFEVYHWLAHQGLKASQVAEKLNFLARNCIVIESPFDRSDPSIVRSLGDRSDIYRLDLLLDSLIEMGWAIEFLGLTNYFPGEYNRARFLATRGLLFV